MSVVIETTLGDITVDLFTNDRPRACLNFLKLCKIKYYNYNLFHTISRGFIAQTGDPTGSRNGGESIYGVLDGPQKRFFEAENEPRIKHTRMGLISFVGNEDHMIGSQFFLSLGEDLTYLDEKHCVFGEVVEGFDILEIINEVICDSDDRPYQDVRITHTVILDDPFPDPKKLVIPSRSPSPSAERLQGGRIAPDEEIDEHEGKTAQEIAEMQAEREAKARATILEMVGDIPDADMAPPENVLFVCKLNPVTNDDDLEIIFSRFGKIKSCEVIRDKKTGDSLQYAFVEFEDKTACENAYFKMDNVLIDDRRIHVDFSQSVSKVKWRGKGRGVTHYDERGQRSKDIDNDIGKGNYKHKKRDRGNKNHKGTSNDEREKTPKRGNSNYRKEYSKNKQRRSLSPSRERDRYSKSPPSNKHKEYDKEKRISKTNRNKSRSPTRKRNSPSPRRNRQNGDHYSSSKYNKKSESPKRRYESPSSSRKYRSYETNSKRKSRSISPRRSYSKRNNQHENLDKLNLATSSRKYSPERKSRGSKKRSDSNYDSSDENEETKRYNKKNKSGASKSHDKSVSKYSSEGKRDENKELHLRKKGSKEYESGIKEEKKKKSKRKKSKYSSEDSDSESDKKTKKKKVSESESSDTDYIKQKSKKKKSRIKKNKRDSSSDRDDYKKKLKKKKKYDSDSD